MFRGTITALATPFRNGSVDYPALEKLVGFQLEKGIDGLLACGCTGEAATLSVEERLGVVEKVLEIAGGRVPVIAGTGTNDTATSIDLSLAVSKLGVDGLLLITPYYNKPTPDGQVEHFSRVADAVDRPVIVYNVPGRTGVGILPETVARLAEHPGIVAIKDAAGSAERVSAIRSLCDMTILSGDDPIALAQVALGAEGVISVVSNIAPGEMSSMMELAMKGDSEEARKIQDRLYPLMKALFLETNPIPVKKALEIMGICTSEVRLPLLAMSGELVPRLEAAMERAGLAG